MWRNGSWFKLRIELIRVEQILREGKEDSYEKFHCVSRHKYDLGIITRVHLLHLIWPSMPFKVKYGFKLSSTHHANLRALTAVMLYRYNCIFLAFNHKKSSCSSGAKSKRFSSRATVHIYL